MKKTKKIHHNYYAKKYPSTRAREAAKELLLNIKTTKDTEAKKC